MVLYRASETHFTVIMSSLNELRQDKTFCDIVLKVGDSQIHAHRSILVAGCPYFKSLFLGNFTEANMKEINLSEVTRDIDALEMIINFIYSGEVEINNSNLGIIVKLSSFFLLESLRNFSAEFMKESLCLKTCLKYYLYSAEHGITDIEENSEIMIKSRFHDFLIYEDNTLNLLPDELNCLIDKDLFEFCSVFSVLQFVTKWVGKGKSSKHVSVALSLLDMLNKPESKMTYSCLNETCLVVLYERLVMNLENCEIENKEDFLSRLKTAIDEILVETNGDKWEQTSRDHDGPSCSYATAEKHRNYDTSGRETELAVVTLSPKLCVIEDYRKAREGGLIHHVQEPFTDAVFDVCVYIPRSKTWFYICELHEQGGLPDYLIDAVGYESRFLVLDDDIVFVDNRGDNIDQFNLKTRTWKAPDVQYYDRNFDFDFENHYQANDVCFVVGKDNQRYMVVRMRLFTDASYDQATEMYFRGYVLGDDGESWDCIFTTTTRIRTNLSDNGGMPEMNARISKTSNEMIVTHSTLDGGWNILFVASLNDPFPQPIVLKSEFIEDQDIFRGIAILEDSERFLIVSNGTKNCNCEVKILYEYKFNSKELTEITLPGIEVAAITKPYVYDDEEIEYPCLCECSTTDGKSIWYIEGNLDIASAFTEVRLDDHMNLVTRRHTPPPFACVSRAYAGHIKKDILTNLRPISRFLIREKEKSVKSNQTSPQKNVHV